MPQEEAGLDIDYDAELAQIQGAVAGISPPPGPDDGGDDPEPVTGEIVAARRRTVTFMGEQFRIADSVGLMPLLKFAAFADVSTQDPRALGAMYAMLRDCIYPGEPGCGECADCKDGRDAFCKDYIAGDWQRFEDHAMMTRAEADELLNVISEVMELISGRPTQQSGTSSPGQRNISRGSTARSSARRGKASRR